MFKIHKYTSTRVIMDAISTSLFSHDNATTPRIFFDPITPSSSPSLKFQTIHITLFILTDLVFDYFFYSRFVRPSHAFRPKFFFRRRRWFLLWHVSHTRTHTHTLSLSLFLFLSLTFFLSLSLSFSLSFDFQQARFIEEIKMRLCVWSTLRWNLMV